MLLVAVLACVCSTFVNFYAVGFYLRFFSWLWASENYATYGAMYFHIWCVLLSSTLYTTQGSPVLPCIYESATGAHESSSCCLISNLLIILFCAAATLQARCHGASITRTREQAWRIHVAVNQQVWSAVTSICLSSRSFKISATLSTMCTWRYIRVV